MLPAETTRRGRMIGLLDGLRDSAEMKSKLLLKRSTTASNEDMSPSVRSLADTLGGPVLDISASSRNKALVDAISLNFVRSAPTSPSLPRIQPSPSLSSLIMPIRNVPTLLAAPATRQKSTSPQLAQWSATASSSPQSSPARYQSPRSMPSASYEPARILLTAVSNNSLAAPIPSPSPSSSRRQKEYTQPCAPISGQRPAPTTMYWSKTPVAGRAPKGVRAHSATVVGSDVWLFGGCDIRGTCSNQVWKLDADAFHWSKVKCSGEIPPPTRAHTSTAYDKRLFIFGGGDAASYFNETYILDTVTSIWSKPATIGTPPSKRRAHAAIFYQAQIIVFGGGNGSSALNDLHALDLSGSSNFDTLKWSELETRGKLPIGSGRGYHSFSLVRNKAVLIGGSDGSQCFNDVHILDLETLTWQQVSLAPELSGLFPRLSHTTTRIGSYLFVFGGHDGNSFSNEILCFNLVSLQWEPRKTAGLPPSPRGYHSSVLLDSRLLVFGGFNGSSVFDEMYTLDLAGGAFLSQITNFTIETPPVGQFDH